MTDEQDTDDRENDTDTNINRAYTQIRAMLDGSEGLTLDPKVIAEKLVGISDPAVTTQNVFQGLCVWGYARAFRMPDQPKRPRFIIIRELTPETFREVQARHAVDIDADENKTLEGAVAAIEGEIEGLLSDIGDLRSLLEDYVPDTVQIRRVPNAVLQKEVARRYAEGEL